MAEKIEQTLAARGGRYGDFRENARITQNIKRAMRDSPAWHRMPPYMQEGFELIATKMGRTLSGDPLYDDNIHDIVGYAKLLQDRMAQDRDRGVVVEVDEDPLYPYYEHAEKEVLTQPASRGKVVTDTISNGDDRR